MRKNSKLILSLSRGKRNEKVEAKKLERTSNANLESSFPTILESAWFRFTDPFPSSIPSLFSQNGRANSLSGERADDDEAACSARVQQFHSMVYGLVRNGQRHLPGFWEHHWGHIASVFNPRLVRSSMCAASLVYTFSSVE